MLRPENRHGAFRQPQPLFHQSAGDVVDRRKSTCVRPVGNFDCAIRIRSEEPDESQTILWADGDDQIGLSDGGGFGSPDVA
jgi:hypothetical protein